MSAPSTAVPAAGFTELDLHRHEMSYFKGIPPNDPINQMMAFSMGIKDAIFINEAARGNVSSVFFLVAMSRDLGIKWTHGLRSLYMTPGGRVGMEGNIMQALLLQNHFKLELLTDVNDPEKQEYRCTRPDGSFSFSRCITMAFAIEQGWPLKKASSNPNSSYEQRGEPGFKPPWKDPANMLRRRSLAFVAREVAPDLLGGIFLPEELQEIEMQESGNGAYSPSREELADKSAEEDSSLAIRPKQITAVPVDQVINIPRAAAPQPEPVPVQQKAPAQAKAEPKPAPQPKPNTQSNNQNQDDPLAGLPKDPPTVDPVVAAQNAFVERQMKVAEKWGLEREKIAPFIVALKGPTKELPPIERPPIWNSALDSLEIALKEGGASAVDAFRSHPSAFGESLREKAVKPTAESNAAPDPLVEAFPKWSAEAVAIAKKIKGNAAMGGFLAKLKAMGFQQLESADALAALNLYKVSQNAVLIAANVGKRHSEVWPVFAKHWERLDPDAQETIKATTAELRGATA